MMLEFGILFTIKKFSDIRFYLVSFRFQISVNVLLNKVILENVKLTSSKFMHVVFCSFEYKIRKHGITI